MKLNICNQDFSLQWDGVYQFAVTDYPNIKSWELERIAKFVAYENMHKRQTEIECADAALLQKVNAYIANHLVEPPFTPHNRQEACIFNEHGKCVTDNFLSHTCTVEVAKQIMKSGKLLSAVQAFQQSSDSLVHDKRNAAGDPADYFDYVMLNWSNTTSGYRLAMERLLGRNPSEYELTDGFIPGVSFHFRYEDIIGLEGYLFDGYHAAKVKDELLLAPHLYACIIPLHCKEEFEHIISQELASRVYYLDYQKDGLLEWNNRVCQKLYTI